MMKLHQITQPAFHMLMAVSLLTLAIVLQAPGSQAGEASIGKVPQQVVLQHTIKVDNPTVLLGDFFKGTGDKAAIAVAYAPEPGKRATFDATWLYRVAQAYGLQWKPLSMKQQSVVKRNAVTIEREEIEDHILAALIDKGIDPDMTVSVNNRSLRLFVPSSSMATIIVENLSYDQRTHRFSAIVSTPDTKTVRVTGRLQKMLNIPVLTRRFLKDELIRAEDLKWIRTPSERVQHDIVMHADDLIGKTPKRGLRAGFPVRSSDVRRPILVKKGSLVTMILRSPQMTLTAQGKALDEGSDGDVVRINNTQSNKVVQAVVTAAGTVSITPASQIAMNQEN